MPKRLYPGLTLTAVAITWLLLIGLNAQSPASSTSRLAWDQSATAAELKVMTWAIYVDGARAALSGVQCSATGTTGMQVCIAPFPAMTPGVHVIEIVAILTDGAQTFESPKSTPLSARFVVIAPPANLRILQPGQGTL